MFKVEPKSFKSVDLNLIPCHKIISFLTKIFHFHLILFFSARHHKKPAQSRKMVGGHANKSNNAANKAIRKKVTPNRFYNIYQTYFYQHLSTIFSGIYQTYFLTFIKIYFKTFFKHFSKYFLIIMYLKISYHLS